ncbi:MAG: hypothetical protein KDA83_02405 [Planctomycetales bacterium]|nr:hypothetical protein [Planctomycetales bacterium]
MASSNRADQFGKLQKVARKHFQPVKSASDRSVFETLIFACCLENSGYEQAEEAYARLQEIYHDWNEVRVTTIPELAESMVGFVDPTASAARVKRSLHSVFETYYAFDLEFLRKENLGKAVEKLKSFKGVTDFGAGYVAQSALGGHVIPLDEAMLKLLGVLDLATPKELASGNVSGLERAIPKAKGAEFFSTAHQLAVQFLASPNSNKVWALIAEIDSDARSRHNAAVKAAAEAAEKEAAAAKLAREKEAEKQAKKLAAKQAAAAKAAGKKPAAPSGKPDVKGAKAAPVKAAPKRPAKTAPPKKAVASGSKPSPTKKPQPKAAKPSGNTGKKPATPAKKAVKKTASKPAKKISKKKPR